MMTRFPNPRTPGWLVTALVVVIAGLASLALVHSTDAAAPARGSLAGKVFDKQTKALVPDVTIDAYALTASEEFHVVTDAEGRYVVENAPTSVYSFTLGAGGKDYVVQERLDVRVGMAFLLESCFELDGETNTAHVLEACDSGFVEEARVATIGPHRFLKPQGIPGQEREGQPGQPDKGAEDSDLDDSSMAMPEVIQHDELECLTYDHFPLVEANIVPGKMIQISRVYFRSDKYPSFYYIDMGSEHPTIDDFQAILPKPSPETERIYYYVESVDANFDVLRTPDYDPEVLEVQDCDDRGFLGVVPNIVVGATELGAAAIPPGFQAIGIVGAAGGGAISTTALVIIVAGGTAGAAVPTIIVTNDHEASPP